MDLCCGFFELPSLLWLVIKASNMDIRYINSTDISRRTGFIPNCRDVT